MKSITKTLLIVFMTCSFQALNGQNLAQVQQLQLENFHKMWQEERYLDILDSLPEFRDTTPNAKNPMVYYYLATSYCRTQSTQDLARKSFQKLKRFSLSPEFRDTVNKEMAKCFARDKPALVAENNAMKLHNSMAPVATNTSSKIASTGNFDRIPTSIIREIDLEEYRSRLFTPQYRQDAEAAALDRIQNVLAGSPYGNEAILSTTHFILIGMEESGRQNNLKNAGQMLENTLAFYQREFGMKTPTYLMTIYLPTTAEQTALLADKIHGLQIDPVANWGYTAHEDQSIVSKTPGGTAFGTLNHELFHLLSHQYFGDISPWLDEGIAALYEASEIRSDNNYYGIRNWREEPLLRYWDRRPSIEQLIEADWESVNRAEMERGKEAAIFASARYFAAYLQEIQQLGKVYQAMQQLTPELMTVGPVEDAILTLETILGKSIAEIDTDFADWATRVFSTPYDPNNNSFSQIRRKARKNWKKE